ncbi:MAG TPA: C40 family peptidase [Chitinophagaceae bacterium]
MIRNLVIALAFIAILPGCASMKPTGSANTKQVAAKPVTASPKPVETKRRDIKFLDDITANPGLAATIPDTKTEKKETPSLSAAEAILAGNSASSENVSDLQLKYAGLLGTDPDQVENTELLKAADQWYGTRYKMGGTTKSGIDCSAFVQAVYLSAFGMMVPRTAFEQFKASNRISAVEMKEGDLVFFNTTGGVSHVGIYLRNNKFIHASSARGVTVSDLFDPYYLKRFLGVGRLEKPMGTY